MEDVDCEKKGAMRMYRIALCDDDAQELDKTEKMLRTYEKEHPQIDLVVDRFENAELLLDMAREHRYIPDILLMDIYMPGKMGIDVAQELRNMGNGAKIVFLTISREHALDAFRVP